MGKFVARFGLRTSLFVLLTIVALVACVQQGVTILADRNAALDAARSGIVDRAARAAVRQTHLISDLHILLDQVRQLPASAGTSTTACVDPFGELVGRLDWLTSLSVFGSDGTVVCSTLAMPGTTIADREYFQAALATGGFVVSDYLISRLTGRASLAAAMPIIEAGEARAVLVAGIDLDWLARVAAETELATATARVVVFDRRGVVIGGTPGDTDHLIGQDLTASALWAVRGIGSGTSDAIAFDGASVLAAFVPLPATGGTLAVLLDRSEVLAQLDFKAISTAGLFAITGLILFILIWQGSEFLFHRPIAALTSAAERLRAGELTARVEVEDFVPDFRKVGTVFNEMGEAIGRQKAELDTLNRRLAELAMTDSLTGLGNRRAFDERLAAEGARCARDRKRLALIMIDIDHFKKFNDRYGHIDGDDALRIVAATVRKTARRATDFAARTGGEEFAVILPDCSRQEAVMAARDLVYAVQELAIAHSEGERGVITVSVGVASLRITTTEAIRDLHAAADASLYRAKHAGRNRVDVHPEIVSLVS